MHEEKTHLIVKIVFFSVSSVGLWPSFTRDIYVDCRHEVQEYMPGQVQGQVKHSANSGVETTDSRPRHICHFRRSLWFHPSEPCKPDVDTAGRIHCPYTARVVQPWRRFMPVSSPHPPRHLFNSQSLPEYLSKHHLTVPSLYYAFVLIQSWTTKKR